MKMKLTDASGSLYSSPKPGVVGIWFGGFKTADFFDATEALEEKRPGAREEIIAEAHYLVFWLHRFPEIGFFFGVAFFNSLLVGLLLLGVAFIFEYVRFYMFGASLLISQLCRIWGYIKIPAFIIAAASLSPQGKFLPITLMVFLIGSRVVMMPINVVATRIMQTIFSEKLEAHYGRDWFKMTALAVDFVIHRWRCKLFPADRFNVEPSAHKQDIEMTEEEKSFHDLFESLELEESSTGEQELPNTPAVDPKPRKNFTSGGHNKIDQ